MIASIGNNGQLGWELVRKGEERGFNILARDYPEIDISDLASVDACFDSTKIDLVIFFRRINKVKIIFLRR